MPPYTFSHLHMRVNFILANGEELTLHLYIKINLGEFNPVGINTCIDYPLNRGVGTLFVRVVILGNEFTENRNGCT